MRFWAATRNSAKNRCARHSSRNEAMGSGGMRDTWLAPFLKSLAACRASMASLFFLRVWVPRRWRTCTADTVAVGWQPDEQIAQRPPGDAGGLEDEYRHGLKSGGQALRLLDQPEGLGEAGRGDRALQQDLILARVGMQGDHFGHPLGRVEADGQVQPILQGLAISVVVAVGIRQILEGGIKDFGERGHGSHLLSRCDFWGRGHARGSRPARALWVMRPSTRPSFQSLACGSGLRGRVPQAPLVALQPSGGRWLPSSTASSCAGSVGFLSGDRPGGATSSVRDRVAKKHDALRSGPQRWSARQKHLHEGRETLVAASGVLS